MPSLSLKQLSILLLAFTLTACGGGGGGGGETPTDNDPPPTNDDDDGQDDEDDEQPDEEPPAISDDPINDGDIDLSDAGLEADSAAVFDLVAVSGLPDDAVVEDLHVEYRFADDEWPIGPGVEDSGVAMMVQPDRSEQIFLLAPLVDSEGTSLKLRITDGSGSYSRTLGLAVTALPAGQDGAIEELLDATESVVRNTTEAYGMSYPDDLRDYIDSPQSIEPQFVPLIQGYQIVANPDNPNGLRSLELTDEERELMERIIVHMELIPEMRALAEYTASDDTLIDQAIPQIQSTVAYARPDDTGLMRADAGSYQTQASEPIIFEGLYSLSGPNQLSSYLSDYETSIIAQQNIEAGAEYAGYAVTAIGLGAAFVVSGPPGAAAASASATASSAATAALILGVVEVAGGAANVARGFVPCCIVSVDMDLDPESGMVPQEDALEPTLLLEGATATVHSDGIDLTEEVLSRALDLVSGGFSDKMVDDYAENELSEELVEYAAGLPFDQIGFSGREIVFEWTDVDISGNDPEHWLDIRHEGFAGAEPIFERTAGGSFTTVAYQLNADTFFGNEQSQDVLGIEPSRDEFRMGSWHPPIPGDSQTIGSNVIDVRFEPAGIRVDDPGQVTPFKVIVTGARDTGIELPLTLEPELGSVVALNNGDEGVYEFEYHAPDDELPAQPIYISTKATSTGGVRSRGEPSERSDSLLVSTDDALVAVQPRSICLEQGETRTFEAQDPLTGDPVDATWSADLGQISNAGNYTAPAPQSPGYATVTATTEEGDATATAHVAFGCTCWWQGTVSGGISESHAHSITSIFLNDQGQLTEFLFGARDDRLGSRIILDTPVNAGATGTFTGRTTHGSSFGTDPQKAWQNTDLSIVSEAVRPPLEVQITRHELIDPGLGRPEGSRIVEATVSGAVTRWEFQEETGFVVFAGGLNISVEGNYSIAITALSQRMLNCRQ